MGGHMDIDRFPRPGTVKKGDPVGFGFVQHTGRGWYLVLRDGDKDGMLGNKGRPGGPGIGCGCDDPTPRVSGGNPARYAIVGPVPERYAGAPPSGYVCGRCNRAMVGRSPGGW
jgi:hypothetical protein